MSSDIERTLVAQITGELAVRGRTLVVEPRVGPYRPDLLIQGGNELVVVEIKTGPGSGHFAGVAQVANYVQAAKQAFPDSFVRGILVTDVPVPEAIAEDANSLGVELVSGAAQDLGPELASRILREPGHGGPSA